MAGRNSKAMSRMSRIAWSTTWIRLPELDIYRPGATSLAAHGIQTELDRGQGLPDDIVQVPGDPTTFELLGGDEVADDIVLCRAVDGRHDRSIPQPGRPTRWSPGTLGGDDAERRPNQHRIGLR